LAVVKSWAGKKPLNVQKQNGYNHRSWVIGESKYKIERKNGRRDTNSTAIKSLQIQASISSPWLKQGECSFSNLTCINNDDD